MTDHKDIFETEGVVTEALPNTLFRVKLEDSRLPSEKQGKIILCHLSGKMRIHRIRILPGDRVKLEVSLYDETKGRIVYRSK